jgi:zinc protease
MKDNSYNIPFEEFELDNGLKVVLSRDSSIPSAAINICYKVGSKDEDITKRGLAHLFEHLMFEGSKNVPNGLYDKFCLMAGGENNAYTNEDKTNYYIVLPSHQLELGLWLESDRMHEFSVTGGSLETQKGVVIEEKKQVFDNKPYGTVSLEFPPRLYRTGGYSWDTIGYEEDISSTSLKDTKKFFENFYNPNNAVLSIAGDINYDSAIKLINKYFGDIPKRTVQRTGSFENLYSTGEVRENIYDNIQFPGIFMAYKVPAEGTPEQFAFDILADILTTGESSRFYKKLVYEKQMVSEIGCYADTKEFTGVFYIYCILMPGIKTGDAELEIEGIINDIRTNGVSENELQKIKNRIETRFAYRKQSIVHKADLLAHYKTFHNDPSIINSVINRYLNITMNDISDAVGNYLVNENRVILNYLPKMNQMDINGK